MWGKADGHRLSRRIGKLFLNLRRVPVHAHPVGLDILIDLAVETVHLGPAPRAGSARFGIDDQGIGIYQPFLHQRVHRQEGTGGETSRVGDQPGRLHLLPVHLRQPVDRLADELRGGVCSAYTTARTRPRP